MVYNYLFFEKLLNEGTHQYQYKNVRKWTKNIDIFSCDKVLIPINNNNVHWTLLVFYMLLKEVHFYDSMSGDGAKYLKNGLRWLADESMDKKKTALNTHEWKLSHQEIHVPQQHNGFDCGVFVVMCTRAIAYNQPFSSYHQSGMPQYRSMIGRHILRGSLLDSNKQSVPYMYNLTPELQAAPLHQVSADLSTAAGNISSNHQSTKGYSSTKSGFVKHTSSSSSSCTKTSSAVTTAAVTGYDSLDSEEDEEVQHHKTKSNQLSRDVNSEDSEEDDESPNFFSVLFANTKKSSADMKYNTSKSQVPTNSSCNNKNNSSTIGKKTSVAAAGEEDSVVSEENEDQLLHQKKSNLLIRGKTATVSDPTNAKKRWSVMKHHSESMIIGEEYSETDCTSETCDSVKQFRFVADITTKPQKGHRDLQRKNQALRNTRWIKKENQRKSGKFYKCALLDLNDTDMSSIPTGADHQVRCVMA